MNKFNFLNRAEKYAESRGDENYFKHWYTRYREYYNIEDSVWRALTWLYDEDTAHFLNDMEN
jgi:hypothetical protein